MSSSPDVLTPSDVVSLMREKWLVTAAPLQENQTITDQGLYTAPYQLPRQVERQLGETEVSYFLPSRESGVNDMYLHLGCLASSHRLDRQRVSLVWSIMRIRHPLLASKVKMNGYNDISFVYDTPISPNDVIDNANRALEFRSQSKDELISDYLNGPRTLSNERLSYLIVSSHEGNNATVKNYDFLICATHFLGDGMALHQFANDFFSLLGGTHDQAGLAHKLWMEWSQRCFTNVEKASKAVRTLQSSLTHMQTPALPSPMESRLSPPSRGFGPIASRIDFNASQQKLIGGHTFPRSHCKKPVHTIVPTLAIDCEKTKKILAKCKRHGVSISSALFSICNVAWSKTHSKDWELPMMMYSALNMRPNLAADKRLNDSYWFLAIGYFNVVLPTFLPQNGDTSATFWLRARSAKAQSAKAAKSPLNVSRCLEMAKERGKRARIWAKEDDDKAMGISCKPQATIPPASSKPKVPSSALIGLSLLGNLDGIYKHSAFPEIKLHTLTTGSRQRSGGMLLFGYTFIGKLWVSLGYDKNGFEEETVKRFWKNVIDSIDVYLLD